MAWWPEAIRQQLPRNYGGPIRAIAVTLHHQAGNGNPYSIYLSRGVSAHFWIPKSGKPYQHVDTALASWHGVAHNAYGLGVETEGCGAPPHAEPMTQHQIDVFARLMQWANKVHGVPLQLSESVSQPGLNYHRCQGGPATGCPCDTRKNTRSEILRRARGQAPTAPKPPAEPAIDLMEDYMQLRFYKPAGDAAPRAAIVVPAPYRDGKARISLAAAGGCQVRVDLGTKTESRALEAAGPRAVDIPKGCQQVIVRADAAEEIIDYCFLR
jgi:hypothetical protein